ncbi:MAG: DUF1871 family protein [Candidatus Doudnabacteria bacterium]
MIKNFESIKKIVNEADPINLLDSAPDNEYDHEIHEITLVIKEGDNTDVIADKIYKIFIESFDEQTAGDKKVYLSIAKKIAPQL